jgi:glycosyltransferase involved in cell wall biosynthesis
MTTSLTIPAAVHLLRSMDSETAATGSARETTGASVAKASLRFAFLTPEFVTDYQHGGGLGTYLSRITQALISQGHEVELFLSSERSRSVFDFNGVRVERVSLSRRSKFLKIAHHAVFYAGLLPWLGKRLHLSSQADALARAMEARHAVKPFDVVQSADFLAVGLHVVKKPKRLHVIRCSSPIDLYHQFDGPDTVDARWQRRLEYQALRGADLRYAPSRFVAAHYSKHHGIAVEVVRPPVSFSEQVSAMAPEGLPKRYFVHFGQLCERKGTAWLSEALRLAFQEEPDLRMVWVGVGEFGNVNELLSRLGEHRHKVTVLYPLPKSLLLAVVKRAEAAVLPSLVDNLPNTVIESLMLGVPVIGTLGASIDEIVEDGVTGDLVPLGDAALLADALVRRWRGQSKAVRRTSWAGAVAESMTPASAVQQLLSFVRNHQSA